MILFDLKILLCSLAWFYRSANNDDADDDDDEYK